MEGLWILTVWMAGLSFFLILAGHSMISIDRSLIERKGKIEG
jgi:hypothetical protein